MNIIPATKPKDGFTELSDSVEIQFSQAPLPKGGFRAGDYWLIPARTATGRIIWPADGENPAALPPHGVNEHYAPMSSFTPGSGTGTGKAFKLLTRHYDLLAK